jgi:hypothetical protein
MGRVTGSRWRLGIVLGVFGLSGCASNGNEDGGRAGRGGTSSAGTGGTSGSGTGGTTGGAGGTAGSGAGGTGGAGGTSGSATAGSGGSAAGSGGGAGDVGACGATDPAPDGWLAIEASVSGLGSGPMDSPIARCESDAGRFSVFAKGNESDGVDATIMRLTISGYDGPSTYSGDAVTVDVLHSDVGGFTTRAGATCTVCIDDTERAGTFTCAGLTPWAGDASSTLDVTSGAFTCPVANVETTATGGSCSPFLCRTPSTDGPCVELEPACAGGVCVAEPGKDPYCGAECDGDTCPSGTSCQPSTGHREQACTASGECGNGSVDIGEQCDEPPPTDRCAESGCVACFDRAKRPGWIDLRATVDGTELVVNDFVGQFEPDCLRSVYWNGYTEGLSAAIPSCDPAADFLLTFRSPVMAGTYPLDGTGVATSSLCVYTPNTIHSDQDILEYCAFEQDGTSDPAESGSVTVDEVLCSGLGARGRIEGHLVYKRTILADTAERVVDPAHAGESIDVSADFELVPWDTSF